MSNPLRMWSTWEHKERCAPSPWCEVMQARRQEIEKGKRCDQQDAQTSVSQTLQSLDMLQTPDVQICFTSLHPEVSDVYQSNGCWAAHFHTSRTAVGAKPHNHEVARSKLASTRLHGQAEKLQKDHAEDATTHTKPVIFMSGNWLVYVFLLSGVKIPQKKTYLIRVDTASSCEFIFVDRSPQEI